LPSGRQVDLALRRDRMIKRYELLSPSDRREAIRASLEFFEKESLNEPTLHVVERYRDHGQNETPEALAEIQRLLEKQQLADDRRAEQAARAAAEGTGDEP